MPGCPTFEISDAKILQFSENAFTLGTTLTVVEDEAKANVDESNQEHSGRAEITIWSPDGWIITSARLNEVSNGRKIPLSPTTPSSFPLTFPRTAGKRSTFVTECAYSPPTTRRLELEVDVKSDGLQEGSIGILINVFQKTDNVVPFEIRVNLKRRIATVFPDEEAPAAMASDKELSACPSRVTRGPRGCSCAPVGTRFPENADDKSILKLLFNSPPPSHRDS
jgi:hypothetical protein